MPSSATLESPAVCCWPVDVDGEVEDVSSSPSLNLAFFCVSTDFGAAVDMASLRSREEFTCVIGEEDQDSCSVEELERRTYS